MFPLHALYIGGAVKHPESFRDGQFRVVSRSKGLVEPEPWSKYTSPDKGCDWVRHKGTYAKKA